MNRAVPVRLRLTVDSDGVARESRLVCCRLERRSVSATGCAHCPRAVAQELEGEADVLWCKARPRGERLALEDADACDLVVDPSTPVGAALRVAEQAGVRLAVVIDARREAIGTVPLETLRTSPSEVRCAEVMTPFVVALVARVPARAAHDFLVERGLDEVPLLEGGRLAGVLSRV